ncbi:hypothetical protein Hanom_Chr12g01175461 [Helianthus anomalus]
MAVQKLPHAGPGFRSCIRVRRTYEFQPNSRLRNPFFAPPYVRVGLVVKHVIKLQWSSKCFTL